jgi:bifunctional NMN adenylyltransferase/nudix hydrolase
MKLGVVLGRFQLPDLHDGHKYLLNWGLDKYDVVIVALGTSSVLDSIRNPLDFETRCSMIDSYYKSFGATRYMGCVKVMDQKLDDVWSIKLDEAIKKHFGPMFKAFNQIDLIGGKDNSLSYYSGSFSKVEIPVHVDHAHINATDIRNNIKEHIDSTDFRKGIIYQINSEYPKVYATVDIAIFNETRDQILLGRKPNETLFRFPGGFSDPTDESFEQAAKREAREEVSNIELGDFKYLGSMRIDDWRYRKEKNKIITSFFETKYLWGAPKASDDLAEVKWFKLTDLKDNLVQEHVKLLKFLNI